MTRSGKFKFCLLLALLLFWAQEGFAPAQEDSFARTLYPVLEQAACRSCHNPDGVASVTRLIFPEADAGAAQIEAFGRSLVELVDRHQPEKSLLAGKPVNRIPHAGGERIKRGSAEEAALQAWVQRLAKLSGDELAAALKYRETLGAAVRQPAQFHSWPLARISRAQRFAVLQGGGQFVA